jgi:hypothetical protein
MSRRSNIIRVGSGNFAKAAPPKKPGRLYDHAMVPGWRGMTQAEREVLGDAVERGDWDGRSYLSSARVDGFLAAALGSHGPAHSDLGALQTLNDEQRAEIARLNKFPPNYEGPR